MNLSLSSDTFSQVSADISYPSSENAYLDAEYSNTRITIEDEGYIYVTLEGTPSDFEKFPYSWTFEAAKEANTDKWIDEEHAAVKYGEYAGDINTNDDTDLLRFQTEAGEVLNLSLASDTPSEVTADISYPSGKEVYLDGENLHEQITVEEQGNVYVNIEGYRSDFATFPYTWKLFVGLPGTESTGPTANISATPTTAAVGEQVTFDATDSTASAGSSITAYEWDFDGDGTAETTGATVTHTYDNSGSYEVSVTVTDATGATDTAT